MIVFDLKLALFVLLLLLAALIWLAGTAVSQRRHIFSLPTNSSNQALDAAPVGLLLLDRKTAVTYANAPAQRLLTDEIRAELLRDAQSLPAERPASHYRVFNLAAAYWLLPISGDVFIMLDEEPAAWPRLRFEPESPRPGERATAILADTTPWVHIKMLVNGTQEGQFLRYAPNPLGGEWFWAFTVPEDDSYDLRFYHDCDKGCVDWARKTMNTAVNAHRFPAKQIPTKLGVVFPNPARDWHGRSAWVVELTYARLLDDAAYWGLDDLAARVQTAVTAGHRVLIRIDYDQNQSIPHNEAALSIYLDAVRRLARDDRLQGAYAFIISSSYNANMNSQLGPITPEWYARIFNGYGTETAVQDNVLAVVTAPNGITPRPDSAFTRIGWPLSTVFPQRKTAPSTSQPATPSLAARRPRKTTRMAG